MPYKIFYQLCCYSNEENCDTFHLTPSPRAALLRGLQESFFQLHKANEALKSSRTSERDNRTMCSSGFCFERCRKNFSLSPLYHSEISEIENRMTIRSTGGLAYSFPILFSVRKSVGNYRTRRYITRIHYGIL